MSCHHQAIDEVGRGLTVVVKDGEIPKLVIDDPKKGNVFLTQFHPEFYIEIPETRKLIEDSFEKYSAEEQAFYAPYLESVFSVLDNTERNKLFYKAFLDNVRMHATITA